MLLGELISESHARTFAIPSPNDDAPSDTVALYTVGRVDIRVPPRATFPKHSPNDGTASDTVTLYTAGRVDIRWYSL